MHVYIYMYCVSTWVGDHAKIKAKQISVSVLPNPIIESKNFEAKK